MPILKREEHRLALRKLVTSGFERIFLGTDSAPHTNDMKESHCGCAGIFNAPTALSSYMQVFDEENACDKFENFASINGPKFYGLPLNEEKITLIKKPVTYPKELSLKDGMTINIFQGAMRLDWDIIINEHK